MVWSWPWLALSGDGESGEVVEFFEEAPATPPFELLHADEEELQIAVVRGFLSAKEVEDVAQMKQHFCLKEIDDRDDELVYRHEVWRMESELKEALPHIYDRLMDHCRALDAELWNEIDIGDRFFPEIEYIVYDVSRLGEPGRIEPHTDNQSQVTVVVMLSHESEFQGGLNYFEPGTERGESRSAKLKRGDAVFFYGDRCEHWISPVVSGRRTILQMELSRGWHRGLLGFLENCCG